MNIRNASFADISQVYAIEQAIGSSRWTIQQFFQELKNKNSRFYVYRDAKADLIIAYMIFWKIENFIELMNFAVKKEYQHRGIGSRLIDFLIFSAQKERVKEILLEVRSSNKKARDLYNKKGFKQIHSRRDYYKNPPEDGLVFCLKLSE